MRVNHESLKSGTIIAVASLCHVVCDDGTIIAVNPIRVRPQSWVDEDAQDIRRHLHWARSDKSSFSGPK